MECEICFEKFDKQKRKPMTILPCTHTFCLECMEKLQYQTYNCPKCKKQIVKAVSLFFVLKILSLHLFCKFLCINWTRFHALLY